MTQWNSVSFSTSGVGQPSCACLSHVWGMWAGVRVCLCVCTFMCTCVHVCACAGCGVGNVRERAALPLWAATLSPSHSLTSQKTARPWGTKGTEPEARPEMHTLLTIHALFTLLWGMWVSTGSIWDHFPKGELPADSKKKKVFFVCLFVFQPHIARLGEEVFVVFTGSQALNLHTEIQIQKDVLKYYPISSGHRVGSTALRATRQQQICYQAAKEIKMYFKMSLWCTLSIFYFSKNTAYLLEISLMC